MPERNNEYVYQPPAKFTEELRQRINNAGFSDEFKQQIKSAQKEEGRKMFERLTHRDSKGDVWIKDAAHVDEQGQICMLSERLAAYEDSGLSPEEVQEFAKAKAEGRLVVLPCKVGSDLWSIERARTKCTAHGEEYSEYSCQGCEEPCDSVITQKIRRVKEASHMTIAHFMQSGCFGKTVFLTREEAEKALGVGE